jgi:NADH-quinone oxidoreductase subunit H
MNTNPTVANYFLSLEPVKQIQQFLEQSTGWAWDSFLVFFTIFVVCFILVNIMALIGGLGTYAERKISADIQMRQGPNRVGPYGLLQFLADGIKMITKEDIIPSSADKPLFIIAPLLCLVGVFASLAVLPISSGFTLSQLNVGVVYFLGISSLVGVGIFLGGYSSNSKWSMLGGMRGASQIISYEIPVTLSIISIVLLAGSLSINQLVGAQGALPHQWFLFHNPFTFIGFFIYFVSALAETNRAPFDLPEAESELVSGYHTEFSGMRFAFFALAEYIEVFVVCAIAVSLFLGGYHVPFKIGGEGLIGQILMTLTFFMKTLVLYYVVIWVRWTLPRLRVDQLMTICWKYLTPISLVNIVGVAFWVYYFDGESLFLLGQKFLVALAGEGGHH